MAKRKQVKKSKQHDTPGITLLEEYNGKKVGDKVIYRGAEWRIDRILRGQNKWGQEEDTYEDSPAPVGFDLVWSSGETSGPSRISVGSHCLADQNVLDAIVSATDTRDHSPKPEELDAISDHRRVKTYGRVFLRASHPTDGPNGTKIKRHIIAGVVLGDLGVGGDGEFPEDELWMCDVIILRPVQRYRGSKCKGYTVDQMLTGMGLQPEGYTTPLKE